MKIFTKKKIVLVVLLSILMLLFNSCVGVRDAEHKAAETLSDGSGEKISPKEQIEKPPTKITMFYQEAGQSFPKDFSHKDNWLMKALCEMANVEITELTVPAYSETETKFNLMMSSGNIPNLVERASVTQMKQYGMEGAFIPTYDIVRNSKTLSPKYDDVMLNAMKSSDDIAYIIQSLPINGDFTTTYIRYDYLQDVGLQEIPSTLDSILEAMRLVQKLYPDKIMLSGAELTYTNHLFYSYDAIHSGVQYRQNEGIVKNAFDGENIIKAVHYLKNLYSEGLLDQEFMTNSSTDYKEKRLRSGLFLTQANRGGMTIIMQQFLNDGQLEARLIPIPIPIANDVDANTHKTHPTVLGGYAFGISKKSTSEEIEGSVRFLEVLFSEEAKELFEYGREGEEYEIVDGEPMPIYPAALENAWRSVYGLAYTTNTDNILSYGAKQSIYSSTLVEKEKASYWNLYNNATINCLELQRKDMTYNPITLAMPVSDDVINRAGEMGTLQRSLVSKAIIGEISMDEFAIQKDIVVKDYEDVVKAYNQVVEHAKDEYGLK